jgi:polygalacturonase
MDRLMTHPSNLPERCADPPRRKFKTSCQLAGLLAVFFAAGCGPGRIAPIEAPFEMPHLRRPVFGNRTFDIRDYGAEEGGSVKNTAAFAAAVDACGASGGGRVLVPAGQWLTGPIRLKSNVNLHLARGSVIKFSDDFGDYLPPVFTRFEGIECYNYCPLVYADGCVNVAITGSGFLDGQGGAWWPWRKVQAEAVRTLYRAAVEKPVAERVFASEQVPLRPSFIQPINCKNVLIEGVSVGGGPMWTIHPVYCENVIIRGITVRNEGPNNDGVNPDSCRNVLIENCDFDTADDAIAVKSGLNEDGWRVGRPCENVVVRHCRFGLGRPTDSAVCIGSEMSGGVRNVLIRDCRFDQTSRGVRIKSMRGRGGFVENVWIENITASGVSREPVLLTMFYGSSTVEPLGASPPVFRNIHVKNVRCRGAQTALAIVGLPESPVQNVTVRNVEVSARNGLVCSDAENVELSDLEITAEDGPLLRLADARSVTISRAKCPAGTGVFLEVAGERTAGIVLEQTDLSNARTPLAADPNVPDGAVRKVDE